MLAALAYALRKYMHKYRYSPEFRLQASIEQLERADTRLNALRRQILARQHTSKRELERTVAGILREERVHRILRVRVEPGPPGGPAFVLETSKTFLLGRNARWMHLHLYVSVAFACAIWMHGGRSWELDLGGMLLALSAVVLATGIVGIVLWAFGPTWLTRRERDLSIEEAFVMREGFRAKLAELRQRMGDDAALTAAFDSVARAPADGAAVHGAFASLAGRAPEQIALFEDACVIHGQLQRVEREFRALWRIRLAFMGWRAVHIPAVVLLCAGVAVHLFTLVRY